MSDVSHYDTPLPRQHWVFGRSQRHPLVDDHRTLRLVYHTHYVLDLHAAARQDKNLRLQGRSCGDFSREAGIWSLELGEMGHADQCVWSVLCGAIGTVHGAANELAFDAEDDELCGPDIWACVVLLVY